MSAGSVEALRALPVEIRAPQPVEMAGGAMVAHPVVLIELRRMQLAARRLAELQRARPDL